jgi:NADH-quinone oxidoreductase subunit L
VSGLLWTLVLLPAGGGGLLALAPARMTTPARVTSLTVAALTTVLAVVAAATRPEVSAPFVAGSSFGLRVDGLTALMLPTVAAVTLLVLAFACADVRGAEARFHGLMHLFAAAALTTAAATTLPTLLLAWEVMGAMSYALIGFWWREEHRVGSGLVAFVTTRAADLGLYLAAGAALAGGTGLALGHLPEAAGPWRHVVAAGVVVAALGKAAQLPFSFWLSRAMDGPSPVSALLHSAAMVAMGGYLLLRVGPLLEATGWAAPTVAWTGAVTALLLGAVALAQDDLKQLLAASTSAQLGFVVLAAGVASTGAGATQLVAHAATKALLFLAAGAWLSALGTKQLDALRGAARIWASVGMLATVGLVSLAGLPPLSLWATKDAVLAGSRHASAGLYVVGLAAAVLSAAYAGKVLVLIWRALRSDAEAGYDTEQDGSRRVGPALWVPLLPLATGATALGLLALPPLDRAVNRLAGSSGEPTPSAMEMAASAVIALLAVAAVAAGLRRGWVARLSHVGVLRGWLRLEGAAQVVVVTPTFRLARTLARFDDRLLDRAVTSAAHTTAVLAGGAARFDRTRVDGAVESVARTARQGGRWARRPQTGLLHQYYIQAVSVVAATIVVLVVVR